MIAAVILGLGLMPLILIGSSAGPQGLRNRLLAVIVTACCLLMAVRWLRRRWPTRTESEIHVVTGTFCIAVACVIQADPVVGLFGATAFTALSAYITFLHTRQLLAFTWMVAAATVCFLAVRVATVDAALAVGGVVVVALINIFVAFACRALIRLIGTDVLEGEIDPVTGLLNRDAFYQMTATLLGSRSRGDDRYFVVAVVNIDSFSDVTGAGGSAAGDWARAAVGQALRENVRRDTIVAHVADAEFLIADTFTTTDPSPLIERVRGAITSAPSRLTASIGVVSTPLQPLTHHPPADILDEALAIATTAMHKARNSGGNQACYVVSPGRTVVDDPDSGDESGANEPA